MPSDQDISRLKNLRICKRNLEILAQLELQENVGEAIHAVLEYVNKAIENPGDIDKPEPPEPPEPEKPED